MFTEADLLQALRDCFEPTLRRDVVSLGLVQRATLTLDANAPGAAIPGAAPRYIAHVELVAPGTDESRAMLAAQLRNRLAGIRALSRHEVEVRPSPFAILR